MDALLFGHETTAGSPRVWANYPRKDDEVRGHALDIEKESKMRGR